ncbi:MAG: hypothetical protein SFY66_21380 [Oculatellaceae cyanobacterium bins.114]|nr:hypothetical protein [Oculatellaceae cyanobacterium bins.114]
MQLIYRAQIIESTDSPVLPYVAPRAIHWRFQAPGVTYNNDQPRVEQPYVAPRAINWRFQAS